MQYVQRLLPIGFPMDDAVSICHSMAKDGDLEAYVARQEREYARRVILEAEADGVFEL